MRNSNTGSSRMMSCRSLSSPWRIALSGFVLALLLGACTGDVTGAGPDEDTIAAAWATGSAPLPPPPERTVVAGDVLFVVGDTNLDDGDADVRDRLVELGFQVTLRRAAQTQVADAASRDLVVISSTITSGDLGNRLRDLAVPLVTWESYLYDDLRLTGIVEDTDFGARDGECKLDVVSASHPIAQAAHLQVGEIKVVHGSAELRFGKPGAAAQVIARLDGSSSKAGVFAYDKGAALVGGGNAAERRVGLFASDHTASRYSATAWRIFDAAILWAADVTLGAPAGDVLFVVGDGALGAGDAAIRARLAGLGYSVALRRGALVQAADAAGRKLVVISGTVDSSTVGNRLRDVAVPLISFEDALFDDLRLTGTVEGTDWGGVTGQKKVNVVLASHPIAIDAGLSAGLVKVVTGTERFRFGRPAAGAQVVARLEGSSSKAAVFTFAAGAALTGGQAAPARRVGAFLDDRTATQLNTTGWKIFDAMVRWAVGIAPPPAGPRALLITGDQELGAGDTVVRARLVALGFGVEVWRQSQLGTLNTAGARVIVISESVDSAVVGTRFTATAVPVVCGEAGLFDELGMTSAADAGAEGGETAITIVNPAHPLAGGLTGTPTVSSSTDMTWGRPAASAVVAARIVGSGTRAAIFGYEPGAVMTVGVAPARRVGHFVFRADTLNANGRASFDAAVTWAAGPAGPVCTPTAEQCNGLDDDCDGVIDDGVKTTFYRDGDGDGFGTTQSTATACVVPAGFVAAFGDCDDTNAARKPGAPELCNDLDDDCDGLADDGVATQTYYRDADADGFGAAASAVVDCAQPTGYVVAAGDCDDLNPARRPGATEVCNLVDDDCDAQTDEGVKTTFYRDGDGDGFGAAAPTSQACTAPAGFAALTGDCDDTNAARKPGAVEVCNDLDDDCDGLADEGVATHTYFRDQDADGYGVSTSTVIDCAKPAGYATVAGDCDDSLATRHPNAPELCNSLDDDCDGAVDESPVGAPKWFADVDADGFGNPGNTQVKCTAPTTGGIGWVEVGGDCNDVEDDIYPGAPEQCDGVDQDCDAIIDADAVWYLDFDADGFGDDATVIATGCPMPSQPPAVSNRGGDCNDGDDHVRPGAPETCNGDDDDCDGFSDEDAIDAVEYYVDADADGYGNAAEPRMECTQPAGTVVNDDDCDDARANVSPGDPELPGNGRDDDCDGSVDEP